MPALTHEKQTEVKEIFKRFIRTFKIDKLDSIPPFLLNLLGGKNPMEFVASGIDSMDEQAVENLIAVSYEIVDRVDEFYSGE